MYTFLKLFGKTAKYNNLTGNPREKSVISQTLSVNGPGWTELLIDFFFVLKTFR
jgi:hypothetical protein